MRSAVVTIWLAMIQAKRGMIKRNVKWIRTGIPKIRPIRNDPFIMKGLSF
jgi:hypothetical protein